MDLKSVYNRWIIVTLGDFMWFFIQSILMVLVFSCSFLLVLLILVVLIICIDDNWSWCDSWSKYFWFIYIAFFLGRCSINILQYDWWDNIFRYHLFSDVCPTSFFQAWYFIFYCILRCHFYLFICFYYIIFCFHSFFFTFMHLSSFHHLPLFRIPIMLLLM